MSDMQAFERQLERRIHRFVGPVRPVDDLAVFSAVADASRSHTWGFTMFSAIKFIAAAAIVALFGGFLLVGVLGIQQEDGALPAAETPEATSETLFELSVPASALPDDISALEAGIWILEGGTDVTGEPEASQANESMRNRAFMVTSGSLVIEPTTEALLWRGAGTTPETVPLDEAVTLEPGEAVYLPSVPEDEIDAERYVRLANPGVEEASGLTFHVHEGSVGAPFGGFPTGLQWGAWSGDLTVVLNPADWTAAEETLFRVTRRAGDPGATIELPSAPSTAIYRMESGAVDHTVDGAFKARWSDGLQGILMAVDRVDPLLTVVGDEPASLLELVATPISSSD